MSKKVKRLFGQFVPEHYDIAIQLHKDKRSFTGSVTIEGVRKSRPSKRITLHQKGLKITNARITRIEKDNVRTEIPVARTVAHKASDEVRLHTEKDLHSGSYVISTDFSGVITKNMDGVYPCFFEDNGVEKELIATQFESHHAREAFPCIDEPEAKATFQLHLAHPTHEIALSNTLPLKTSKDDGGFTTTTFKKTPLMSTYLLAFVVGELEQREATSKSGVTIRTFATKNQIEHSEFALEEACAYMDFYEDYYDIPFPLEKCDFVALPDFASGAMENWGLITFREQTLLVDPHTSLHTKQYVAIVVAHELTHQWFGNLVTMKWWTDLWLNEGFASWMEYLAVDDRHPDWHLWTQFSVDEQQTALKMDALEHTHPIEVEVRHPDEIRTIFDIISYQKGASVIHMLHDYLGANAFRDGLRHYLQKHAYGNTHTIDLWQALEKTTKKPVKDFMHDWISQAGFPLVSVSTEPETGYAKVRQSIFVSNPESAARKKTTLWPVPLLCSEIEPELAPKKHANAPFTQPIATNAQKIVKINQGQTGFYRAVYDKTLQNRQIVAIKAGEISEIDRMGLLSDSFEVTKAGYQSAPDYLELLRNYSAEDTLPVWEIIAGSIGTIRNVLSLNDTDDTLREQIKPFVRKLTAQQLDRLSMEQAKNENHLDTLLRPTIVGMAAGADNSDVVSKLLALYKETIESNASIDPDIRGIVYATAARKGGNTEYEQLLKLYRETSSSDEKLSITGALTSFEQPELHTRVLSLLSNEQIKFQDVPYWIAYSLMNRHSRMQTWEWMKQNWDWMKKHMGSDLSFSRFPLYAARCFADNDFVNDYTAFFGERMEPIIQRSYDQGLEIAQTQAAWRVRDAEHTARWFKNQSSTS